MRMKVSIWLLCSLKFFGMILLMTSLSLSGTNAIKLDCDYESDGFDTYCTAKNLQVTKPNEIIDGVVADYKDGNDAVVILSIQDQTFNYFPTGIELIFKKLTRVTIGFSQLKRITQADLKPFTELKGLWILSNEIEILEKNLFKLNTKLTAISFSKNKLQYIDSEVFEPLTNLMIASFYGNPCINFDATDPTEMQELKNEIAQSCQNQEVLRKHSEALPNEM